MGCLPASLLALPCATAAAVHLPAPLAPALPPPLQVALMAVSALTVLLTNCLEESQFVAQPPGRRRLVLEGPLGAALGGSDSDDEAAGGWVGGWWTGRDREVDMGWGGVECCGCGSVRCVLGAGTAACVCRRNLHGSNQLPPPTDPARLPLPCRCSPAAGSLAAQIDAEFNAHMAAVEGHTDAIITGCFALLPRLEEIESMVGGCVGGPIGCAGGCGRKTGQAAKLSHPLLPTCLPAAGAGATVCVVISGAAGGSVEAPPAHHLLSAAPGGWVGGWVRRQGRCQPGHLIGRMQLQHRLHAAVRAAEIQQPLINGQPCLFPSTGVASDQPAAAAGRRGPGAPPLCPYLHRRAPSLPARRACLPRCRMLLLLVDITSDVAALARLCPGPCVNSYRPLPLLAPPSAAPCSDPPADATGICRAVRPAGRRPALPPAAARHQPGCALRRRTQQPNRARCYSCLRVSCCSHRLPCKRSDACNPRLRPTPCPSLRPLPACAGSPDAEPLIDDGLRLWSAVLATSEQLPQPLQELLAQRLPTILRRGQDTAACLKIAEGHALLGGAPALPSAAGGGVPARRKPLPSKCPFAH